MAKNITLALKEKHEKEIKSGWIDFFAETKY